MKKPTEKQSRFILYVAAALVIFLLLLWYRNYERSKNQTPQDTLDNAAGMTGMPISPAFQYGQQSPFQINLGDYAAQVPQFHYDGNQTVYMPLFGFVGYGAQ